MCQVLPPPKMCDWAAPAFPTGEWGYRCEKLGSRSWWPTQPGREDWVSRAPCTGGEQGSALRRQEPLSSHRPSRLAGLLQDSWDSPSPQAQPSHPRSKPAVTEIGKSFSMWGNLPIIYIAFPLSEPNWLVQGFCPGNIWAPNKLERKTDVEIRIKVMVAHQTSSAWPPHRLTSAGNSWETRVWGL